MLLKKCSNRMLVLIWSALPSWFDLLSFQPSLRQTVCGGGQTVQSVVQTTAPRVCVSEWWRNIRPCSFAFTTHVVVLLSLMIIQNVLCDFCRFGDHYEWNKVTSCIHNILSGQRWIEHYGEMSIKNINSNDCQCKITFVKVRKSRCLNPWVSFKCLCTSCDDRSRSLFHNLIQCFSV